MNKQIVFLLLFTAGVLCLHADDHDAALEKLHQIPVCRDLENINEDKLSPELILTAKGAFINNANSPVPFDHVLAALAALPRKAWSNGRVLLYFSFPPGMSVASDWPSRTEVKKIEAELKSAGVELVFGTSN